MRDTSGDNDGDVDMSDSVWHRSRIMANINQSLQHQMFTYNDELVFKQGIFGSSLKTLIKPTMKGFWVPISIQHDAELKLHFPELIGLQNCSEHVSGKITIKSKSISSIVQSLS